MIALIGLWAHATAAALYACLAVWAWRSGREDRRSGALVAAFAAMAVWAAAQAISPGSGAALLAEAARNVAFLGVMYVLHRDAQPRALSVLYGAVAAVAGLQAAIALLPSTAQLIDVRDSLSVTFAAGALVLVHNLYAQAARASRWGIRLPVIALAAMWAFDFHLYTVAYVTDGAVTDLQALRAVVAAMLVPLFAAATRRNSGWRVQLSRSFTFRSLSLIALAAYFVAMLTLARAALPLSGDWVRLAQAAFILLTVGGAVLILPSPRARARLHVLVAKHLFEHRYDYREDWLRFSRTIGRSGGEVGERVVQALAELAGAPAGLLLQVDEGRHFVPHARWNWRGEEGVSGDPQPELSSWLERSGWVIDFSERGPNGAASDPVRAAGAWAGVPLIHGDRLLGLVLLAAPTPPRPLDWEDFDLLKAAGSQAASHLAEAQGQEALGEARRFDEFNRRFAFIMHDIKNLMSQLSLVARNAERHADNPAFRADMIATLQSSVKKMNDLLARLPREAAAEPPRIRPVPVRSLLNAVVETRRAAHPIEIAGDPSVHAAADWERLAQAVGHLVQNAVEASVPDVPVTVWSGEREGQAVIEVRDRGRGMSDAFIHDKLYRPFVTTKDGGFGIGAYEARSLIAAMGGRLDVESREGEGTCFTIRLPRAEAPAAPLFDRISA